MAVTTLHTLSHIVVDVDGTDFNIYQIGDQSYNANLEQLIQGGDGQVDSTFVAVGGQAPTMSFTTTDIKKVLDNTGISGLAIAPSVGTGVSAWLQKIAEGGTRTGGSNNIKLLMAKGMIVPRTLTAGHNVPATIGVDLIASYNLTALPFVISGSAAITGTPTTADLWTCGKCVINGTVINGVQSITIDFGLQIIQQGSDGIVYPTFVAVQSRQPMITIECVDATALTTFGLSGVAQSATDSVIYLRKIDEGGTRVADATETHISFTIDEGHVFVESISGGHNDPASVSITLTPTWDGSNDIIVIDTTAAIA